MRMRAVPCEGYGLQRWRSVGESEACWWRCRWWRAARRLRRIRRAIPHLARDSQLADLSGGGRGIRTPMGLAPRWISSPLPYQLRLALRARKNGSLRYNIRPLDQQAHGSARYRAGSTAFRGTTRTTAA